MPTDRDGFIPTFFGLSDNGGPTPTFLPRYPRCATRFLPMHAEQMAPRAITIDQRGFARPSGSACDIGAVEIQQSPMAPVAIPVYSSPGIPRPARTSSLPHYRSGSALCWRVGLELRRRRSSCERGDLLVGQGCGIEHTFDTVDGWASTRSCTAIPTSRSSTGRATRRSWSAEAARLGLAALAVTDHDGFYGIVRFALAAQAHGLPTVFGAELTLGITAPANGEPDPEGEHLLVLAEGPVGHARLSRAISEAQMAGEKGAPRTSDRAARRRGSRVGAPPSPRERAQRLVVRAHRLSQGHGARGARARRPGRGAVRARPSRRRVRARPRAGGAVGPRRPARPSSQRRARARRDRTRAWR